MMCLGKQQHEARRQQAAALQGDLSASVRINNNNNNNNNNNT